MSVSAVAQLPLCPHACAGGAARSDLESRAPPRDRPGGPVSVSAVA